MPKSLHLKSFRIAFLAALALFFAQLGAIAHVYSHGLDATSSGTQRAPQGNHDFCGDCLNFAPLLATAGAPVALPLIAPHVPGTVPVTLLFLPSGYPPLLAFRSRAPPTP